MLPMKKGKKPQNPTKPKQQQKTKQQTRKQPTK